MDLELKGKVALVTGSSKGLGNAIALALQAEGCTVVLNARSVTALQTAAQKMGVTCFAGDVSVEAHALDIIHRIVARHGGLDIVVCNAGSGASVPPGQETWEEWDRMLGINLRSTVNIVGAARSALASRNGVALCISSICGSAALGAPLAYSAAKAALNSYVRGISRVLAREGVRINALSPGNVLFEGSGWEKRLRTNPLETEDMLKREVALQRLGTAEEIANVAAFLCSPKSGFITGEVLVADGGQLRN